MNSLSSKPRGVTVRLRALLPIIFLLTACAPELAGREARPQRSDDSYPAFKENVEAILPWTGIMKRGLVFEALLRFMDQQRRNNFSFFQECSGNRQGIPMAFVPYENLGTLELGGQTGNVGKEIYGSGESVWMYLMFEALGRLSDRELMLVNLDLLDTYEAKTFPAHRLNFILFNPTADVRSATITIPPAEGRKVRLSENGKIVGQSLQVPARAIARIVAEF